MKNILMITTAFCVGVGGGASAQAWQVAEELAAIAAEEALTAEASTEVVVDSPDPRLMALGGVGAVTEEVVKSPPPTPQQGQTVYFDGAVKITDMIPALMLRENILASAVPSLPSSAPYFATSSLEGWRGQDEENIYAGSGTDGALPFESRYVDSFNHEATKLPTLHRGLQNHVKMEAKLIVKEATPAFFSITANVLAGAGTSGRGGTDCKILAMIGGKQISPEPFKFNVRGNNKPTSGSLVSLIQLDVGQHDFELEVHCPAHRDGSEISSIKLSALYGSNETPIEVFNAVIPEQAESGYIPPKPPATGVIWMANSPEQLTSKIPEIGIISEAVELVSQWGQQLNFARDTHNIAFAAKTLFYPSEPGIYQFMVISRSNICHAGHQQAYTYGEDTTVFAICYRARGGEDVVHRHPAIMLTLEDDRRAIITSYHSGSASSMMTRNGAVEMTKDDVNDGVVLSYALYGDIGTHRWGAGAYDYRQLWPREMSTEGKIVDGGETFRQVSGKTDENMAFTPTENKRASMSAMIFVKSPSDTSFRLLNEDDVSR